MKVTLIRDDFAKRLSVANRFVSPRAQLPILGTIVLDAQKTKIRIKATNLEMSYVTALGSDVSEEGSIALPAKTIGDIISTLQTDTVTLSGEAEKMTVTTQNYSGELTGMNTADFPTIPESLPADALTFPFSILSTHLEKLLFAASSDETRPILTGVLISVTSEGTTFVATDGIRLSRIIDDTLTAGTASQAVIPRGVLLELSRLKTVESLSFSVLENEKQIVFGLGDTVISSGVLDGQYPNYEAIIPTAAQTTVHVSREDMLQAVKLASVIAREAANNVVLDIGKESITVLSESSGSGSQSTTIDAKVTGDPLKIGYNYRFVEDFLSSVKGEDITMEFIDTSKAGIFKDSADESFLHLIMPVKI